MSSDFSCRTKPRIPLAHVDFKPGASVWLVRCCREWVTVVQGRCSGCGADVSGRFK